MRLSIILITLLAVGCATTSKMNRLSLGMTKDQVIDKMGTPDSTRATAGTEILAYQLVESNWPIRRYGEYFVKFQDDKVTQYGKVGDFGSTVQPTQHVIIDKTETVKETK